jgi:hypothetical protein
VVNCGHANWNEVRSADHLYIYDTGACRSFNANEVRALVVRRTISAEDKVTVIISHWDIDHFHALLAFEAAELDKIERVIAPDNIPETDTYVRVMTMLENHKIVVNSVPYASRSPHDRHQRSIELIPFAALGNIYLLRATAGASRNQTGIVLAVAGLAKVQRLCHGGTASWRPRGSHQSSRLTVRQYRDSTLVW